MAYAGTPSDLAKQPGSTTSGRTGSTKPLITAIAVLAIIVVGAMAFAFVASNKVVGLPTPDRAYDQVEAQRGTALAPATVDRSYDQIEAQRGAATLPAGPTGMSRAQIASLQQSIASTNLTHAQVGSIPWSAGPAGLSRAQIASLQQSIAASAQSFMWVAPNGRVLPQSAALQQSVSRMVYSTTPKVTLRRTAHKAATGDHSYDSIENLRLRNR
jgi:hypothetical protein